MVFLSQNPLCVFCKKYENRDTEAVIVDHIIPHKGDYSLFWDSNNWQSLCATHHSGLKADMERGRVKGCDINGLPIDANHHWA
jgi:5-methylcytosine-specific restriction enzyme A